MELTWHTFPYGRYDFQSPGFRVEPLNYGELIAFIRGYSANLPDINRYLTLYMFLRRKYADQNFSKLLLPDIAYITYYTFALSLTPDAHWTAKYQCSCGTENEVLIMPDQIKFKKYDQISYELPLPESGEVIHYQIPTGERVERVLSTAGKYKKALPLETLIMLAGIQEFAVAPNEMEKKVMESVRKDAYIFMELSDIAVSVFEPYIHRCGRCGAINYIKYASLIETDFFRFFVEHNKPAPAQSTPKTGRA